MRSEVGGCVENSLEKPSAENGLAIIIAATDCVPAVFSIGIAAAPPEILLNAEASASGSSVNLEPSSSASYSRVREIAICISDAAIGARIVLSSTPSNPKTPDAESSRSSRERPPPKYMSE